MAETGVNGFVLGVLNWVVVLVLRRFFPSFWEGLDKRLLRLTLVAITASLISLVSGIIAGHPWPVMTRMAISAFATSIAARELTKTNKVDYGGYMPEISRKLSIKTDVPEPDR